MSLRRRRFGEVIDRQLAFFLDEDGDLLTDAEQLLDEYRRTDRDDSEERFGDYQLALDAAAERLAEIRDAYAATLADDEAGQYIREFNREVAARWKLTRIEEV